LLDHRVDGFLVQDTAQRRLILEFRLPMRLTPLLAWLLLVAIAFVTLAPIGFRPNSGYSPSIERFAAFGAVGFLFALAYPRRLWLIVAIVLGAAIAFEALQLVSASRHGRVFDLAVKLVGGGAGIAAGVVVDWVWRRLRAGRAA
jgi:glycopeptide antibiotics resistance protein